MARPSQQDPDTLVEAYEQLQTGIQNENYNVVDQIGQICQSIMWGDKNNDTFFDYFCDQKTMFIYQELVKTGQREVVVAVIKSITMLLQNIQRPMSINYILSHSALNAIITAEYNFKDDEIIAYYINLLKCVSIRIDDQSLQLFYNLKFSVFPMLMRAIGFYKHKENLIRTSVRNIVLGITKIEQKPLRRYVQAFPFALFYVQFSCYMRDALFYINALIQEGRQESHKIIKLLLDDQLDILYFLEDLLKTNSDSVPIIVNSIMAYGFIPTVVMGIIKSNQQILKPTLNNQRSSMNHQMPQKQQHQRGNSLGNFSFTSIFQGSQNQQQTLDIKFCLFILIQIYKSFSFNDCLDLLTLCILGQDQSIVDFITQLSIKQIYLDCNAKLHSYEKDTSMSEVWNQKEKLFINTYSQYIYKDCELPEHVNINDKDELIKAIQSYDNHNIRRECIQQSYQVFCEHFKPLINDQKRSEDFMSITEMCDIQLVKSQLNAKPSPMSMKRDLNSNILSNKTPFHALLKHLSSNDDTVVFMVLLFIKTLRHAKNISHSVLEQVGMITPDKNLELYKKCSQTRYYLQDKLLTILETGLPPYRLGTFILSLQLFLDFSRTDLETYELTYKERFYNLVINQIEKISSYIDNPLEVYYVMEFFNTEYKVLNKTSISIWPQTHIQLLYEMSQKGVCQIDIKHNESLYFMEPVSDQDKIRKDLLVLLLMKYAVSVFAEFQDEDRVILDNPKPLGEGALIKYIVGNIYDLTQEPYVTLQQHHCKYQNTESCILEDSHNLVMMDLQDGTSKAKCLMSYSFKYTSEMIEKLNLKKLHVIHRLDNQSTIFDLEFLNKTQCSEAKHMIESKKTTNAKNEASLVKNYLQALRRALNYIK